MALMGGGSFSSGMLVGGKYRLQKQLGEGAMGVVWSAVNSATGGPVALKLIVRSDQELQTRLVREARACGLIRHKNVVQVHDVGTTETGDPFLVMELLQGETLAALLARKRRLPPSEAASIARDVARALAATHAQDIIHRDLKPANIFLHTEPGEEVPVVKVVDFGVSKNLAQSDGLRTVAGGAVGSPMYMSPEQARAERDVDFRADIWSLGVVLYEMLAGERPFLGDATEVLVKIATAPIPRIAKRVRKIDPDLDRIVAGCLTRERGSRIQPAAELARQLEIHALPPAREPLPSLMDTGGYDAPPVASPSSGGAPFSPGMGPTSLQSASSPGTGRTDLRPSSQGGLLRSGSSPASGSGGSPLHRSGPWDRGAADDDDLATRPLDAKMLAPLAAQNVADDDWGRGGTIPIHPQQAALVAAASLPVPPAPPAPVSSPGVSAPPPRSSSSGMGAPASPRSLVQATLQMNAEPLAFAQQPPIAQHAPIARTQRLDAAPVPTPVPVSAPPKRGLDRRVVASIGVALLASIAAVAVWRLTSSRGTVVDTSIAQSASQPAVAPGSTGVAAPSTASSQGDTAPPAVSATASATAEVAPPPASTPTVPVKTTATPGATGGGAPPKPTVPPKSTATQKAATTAKASTPPKKECKKNKFGVCTP